MAILMVLESLSPVERAAYLLRRIFDYGYSEIAEILSKPEPSCRQLVSRAEGRILERRPRFEPEPAEVARFTEAFIGCLSSGDLDGLVGLLAADAVLYSDGGGKVPAALAPIRAPFTSRGSSWASRRKRRPTWRSAAYESTASRDC